MNAIEIKGLEKRYDGFQLGSFDLTLPSGCIMGLVGENGAGKSTTIKLIMNAMGRDAGEISVLGVDNRSAEFRDVKEDIGVVLDEAYFPEVMSARNVGKVMALTYKNWDAAGVILSDKLSALIDGIGSPVAAALVLLVIAAAAQIASFEVSVRFYEMKRK